MYKAKPYYFYKVTFRDAEVGENADIPAFIKIDGKTANLCFSVVAASYDHRDLFSLYWKDAVDFHCSDFTNAVYLGGLRMATVKF